MRKIFLILIIILIIYNSIFYVTANSEVDKIIYLSFDDGPSHNTSKILDILKQYNIKATFFVVKREGFVNIYKRIINEGHTLGGHSATHRYNEIYKDTTSYYKDLNLLDNYIYSITGFRFNIIRFPGGSNNTISTTHAGKNIMQDIITKANKLNYIYYDWNVDSEDANNNLKNSKILADNVIKQCYYHRNSIVLMHDSPNNITTPDSLNIIIPTLISEGYKFSAINSDTPVIKFK